MIRSVLYRDRQEVQAADLNNSQAFVDASFQSLIMDAVTGERMFTGLQVTMKSATELEIAPGRLWAGDLGRIFEKTAAEVLSVFSYLPVQDQKYLCLSVLGQEQDVDVQPRDFLVDLQSGQTEPAAVAMERARVVAVQVTPGLESASPQKPEAPTGYTIIAMVLLNASGIVSIELAENKRLMRLFEVWQGMKANAAWIDATKPKIASLMSDLANLSAQIGRMGTAGLVVKLAAEVGLLRDKLSLPAVYSEYDADNLLTRDKSDTLNPEFHALVQMGARFPWAGEIEQQMDLFNPYETAVRNFAGFLLPAHEVVARTRTTGLAGELLLSQYQYQTLVSRELTRTRRRTEYSPTWRWCTNGANWGYQDQGRVVEEVFEGEVPAGVTLGDSRYSEQKFVQDNGGPEHYVYDSRNVWVHTWKENYWVVDSIEKTVSGSVNAQTILNSQNGWLRKIGLTFTKKAADGAVHMLLCDTVNGLPNPHRTLGSVSVDAGDIKADGTTETVFEFLQPIFLSPGKRYAIVLVTGGAHTVALVEGTEYSQGTLFYSTDGEYFQGDFTKDLMMTLYYAKFTNPRTVVDLKPVSLAEGIAAFDILHEAIIPDATDMTLEYQSSGSGEWVSITSGTTDGLLGLPAMCRLRAVFNGSQDIMPGLGLSGSKFRAARPGTTFKHISAARNLGEASDSIDVILRLENWEAAKHTCTVKLLSGGDTYVGTVVDEDLGDETIRRTVSFTPNAPTGISTYKIQIEGTTTTALKCFHVAQRMDVAK